MHDVVNNISQQERRNKYIRISTFDIRISCRVINFPTGNTMIHQETYHTNILFLPLQ